MNSVKAFSVKMAPVSSSYALGILFLVVVSVLWTACSMVVQHLYQDYDFDSPFLIVYIGTSLFSVFLPARLLYERHRRCWERCKASCAKWRHCWKQCWEQCREQCWEQCWKRALCCDCKSCCCCSYWRGDFLGGIFREPAQDTAQEPAQGLFQDVAQGANKDIPIIPWKNHDLPPSEDTRQLMPPLGTADPAASLELGPSAYGPIYEASGAAIVATGPYGPRGGANGIYQSDPNYHAGPASQASPSHRAASSHVPQSPLLSHVDHIRMASKVAPLWFLSNYFYAQSLEWTSIASSTVLASTGSLFACLFAIRFGDEKWSATKGLGVLLCFVGGVSTAWDDVDANRPTRPPTNLTSATDDYYTDTWDDWDDYNPLDNPPPDPLQNHNPSMQSFLGDMAGLLSAIGYGAYTVLIRNLCPRDENQMSMQLLFGYIGLWNMILLFPIAIWVSFFPQSHTPYIPIRNDDYNTADDDDIRHSTYPLTWSIFLFLILKGLLDNVLSDYLWARAVILTSATVASVGVGLTIPMAFVADWIMGNDDQGNSIDGIYGALAVLMGFVLVNVNVFHDREDAVDDEINLNDQSVHDVDILS